MKRYSVSDFKNSTPEWKRKKDPLIGRFFYRPISYVISYVLSNIGIKANTVSFFSIFISLIGCALFFVDSYWACILGSLFFVFWAILDCVDGDIARTIGKQPFGEFADSVSCYFLQALMSVGTGYAAYNQGGVIFDKNSIYIIVIGCVASISNLLMRLVYQKYLSGEKQLVDSGIISKQEDVWKDNDKVTDWKVKFKEAMGVGGWLPIFTVIASIIGALDIVTIYCFLVYLGASVITITGYVRKAYKIGEQKVLNA